ncbi:MAG: hypothetical protein IPH13_17930 [Planctomycetes bacterium]|nr:hypothetical protein [Planctomycetota bacterium]
MFGSRFLVIVGLAVGLFAATDAAANQACSLSFSNCVQVFTWDPYTCKCSGTATISGLPANTTLAVYFCSCQGCTDGGPDNPACRPGASAGSHTSSGSGTITFTGQDLGDCGETNMYCAGAAYTDSLGVHHVYVCCASHACPA